MHRLRLALIALALLVFGAVAWRYANPPPAAPVALPSPDAATARRQIGGAIEASEFAGFFSTLRAHFPADYATILDGFVARRTGTGALDSADVYAADTVRSLRQIRGMLAVRAEPAALQRLFDAQAALMVALSAEDARLCVDFLYGGASDAYFAFSARNRRLVAAMAEAGLAAMLDGQQRRAERGSPTDADFAALEQALKTRGLGKPEIDALLDGKVADPPLPDARLCEAGRLYLDALKALPEPARMRIYGLAIELMARS